MCVDMHKRKQVGKSEKRDHSRERGSEKADQFVRNYNHIVIFGHISANKFRLPLRQRDSMRHLYMLHTFTSRTHSLHAAHTRHPSMLTHKHINPQMCVVAV